MKSWLAAYVRLYHEKKTRDRLTAMGIESFLPVQEEIHQWSDRRKKIERVVIPMMIFVHVDPAERAEVLTLSSVSRYMVLRGQSTPAVIPRRADGALPLHARLLRRSHRSVLLPPRPRRTGASHQRPPRRTGRRAGDHRRQKQGGGKAGYAGLRPCGYAGGVRGESGKDGGGEMNMFHPLKYNIEILNRSVASSIKAFPLLIQLGNPYFMGKLSPMEAA